MDNPDPEAKKQTTPSVRAEIDTSAPFESVKEAASRFGGIGFWRPTPCKHSSDIDASEHESEGLDISKLEEEAAQLERDLIVKERETLDVLKELEKTKVIVEELKAKARNEASDVNPDHIADSGDEKINIHNVVSTEEENHQNQASKHQEAELGSDQSPSSAPGLILLELKQAKLNLSRTTNDLADIRSTVDSYKQKIEKERISMERTNQRVSSNVSKISSLEEELIQARQKLEVLNDGDGDGNVSSDNPMSITQRLSTETEQFKLIGELARSEILKAMSDIEQIKIRLKTAEISLVAAKKMKVAARATEAAALAEIKALSNSDNQSEASQENSEGVTLTVEEYTSLISKAQGAEEASKTRVIDALLLVDEANLKKTEILKKVEEATEEVKTSKKALEEALSRVEAANRGKLVVEEALRKWRSERGQKKRIVHNAPKFKNAGVSHHRRDCALLDVNGRELIRDELKPELKPTLSIGQILSRKLLLTEDYEGGMQQAGISSGKRKVSLGQMLGKTSCELQSNEGGKENNPKQKPAKRKKFGFAKMSFLGTKQSKKNRKKKQSASSRSRSM